MLLKKSLPAISRQKITQLPLALHSRNPEALTALRAGWSEARQAERFRPIDKAFYQNYQQNIGASGELIQRFATLIR